MELKLETLVASKEALAKLNQTEGLKATCAYRIAKNCAEIDKELKIFAKSQAAVIDKYCIRDDKGNPKEENGYYKIDEKYKKEYLEEMQALYDEMVDIQIKKISVEDIDNAGLSPAQLSSINFMLED